MITTMNKCKRCGYEWSARTEKPKECPECKSRKWATEKCEVIAPERINGLTQGVGLEEPLTSTGTYMGIDRSQVEKPEKRERKEGKILSNSERLRQMRESQ